MIRSRPNLTGDYGLAARGVVFDPMTLTVASMAATAAGGAISAASTLAGGDASLTAAQLRAQQLRENAGQAIASSQRQMFDTQDKTRRAISTVTARAAASGAAPDVGSPLENAGQIEKRGSYHALMDMFNGQSEATGLANQAKGVRYTGDLAEIEGKQKKIASRYAAAATLAGTAGSMGSTYGKFQYPTASGRAGVDL